MTYKNSLRKRRLAIFLLISFLQSVVLPPVASALTSGPTAPEAMSFEPVDATDMVNLMTGDFTYNVPLLEVPGPEGGYPLSLSYHAGIKPLEDASWVGLGWNLSPGAINRAVNGYPDDHKGVTRSVEDYWQGGTTKTYSVGVGIGIPGGPQLGLDISVSNDTYRGFGGDMGLSFGVGKEYGLNASIGVSVGTSGFRAGPQIGLASQAGYGLSAGFSTDFKGGSAASLGVSHRGSRSALGVSMSSQGVTPSLKAGGVSTYQHNNNSGNISTRTSGMGIAAPIGPVILSLGFRHTRYWMHETDVVTTNGTLYADESHPGTLSNGVIQDEHISFDSYSLHQTDINIAQHNDPEWVQGGSYPAYDNYSVTGQGISGNIQPYIFENGSLYRKQIKKSSSHRDLSFYHLRSFTKKVNFRFVNDFSNTLQVNTPNLFLTVNNPYSWAQSYSVLNSTGYNSTDQHLAGSKHIEWYTNQDIINGSATTLMDYPGISTTERTTHSTTNDLLDQMGGVSITNESGVTYHYALPVYSFDEYSYTRKEDSQGSESWNKQHNNEPYAYTWLLTAVTGPDYVDKNDNDRVDKDDWGYWVEFEYGKWAHDYAWRSPSTGTFRDINEESDNFAYGKKAIYYLDAVRTRTHTALFVKDIRKDGKSVTDREDGGFLPQQAPLCYLTSQSPVLAYLDLPISTMRLDKILLFKNTALEENNVNLNTVRNHGSQPGDYVSFFKPCDLTTLTKNYHYSDNVIDVSDMGQSAMAAVMGDALKTIEFDNDHYDLCPETANSFNEFTTLYTPAQGTLTKAGKLTLKSLKYRGRNNSVIMPPLNFSYDYDSPTTHNYNVGSSSQSIWIGGANPDWVGDMVKYTYGGKDYYMLLTGFFGSSNFNIVPLGENIPHSSHSGAGGYTLVKTKNAPFSDSKYDYWGFYKPDFTQGSDVSPGNIARIPTTKSVRNTDAWSLRSIESSLGATIDVEYENKKYEENVWQKYDQINFNKVTRINGDTQLELEFHDDIDLQDAFAVGDVVKFTGYRIFINGGYPTYYIEDDTPLTVQSVSSDKLVTNNPFSSIYHLGGIGFLKFMRSGEAYGNGLRAKSITVNGDGNSRTTIYNYDDGCISYNPSSLEYIEPTGIPLATVYEHLFKKDLSKVIAMARELPAPAVMYETVSISEEYNGVTVPGSRRYTFQVPKEDMVTIDYSTIQYGSTSGYPDVEELSERNITLKDKTAQIGNLLKVEILNGQGLVTSRTENDYTDDESGESESDYDAYNDQGIIHQAFHEMRTKHTGNEDHRYIKAVVSMRQEFPSILKSTSNYSQNLTTVTKHTKYDFYSGQLLETETENHRDEFYRQESIPAYKKYDQMGLKVNNISNRHMLSQTAYTQTSEIDDWGGTILGVLNAEATTWNDDWDYRTPTSYGYYNDIPSVVTPDKIWRKHKQLVWRSPVNPDGTMTTNPNTSDQDVNWLASSPISSNWEAVNTFTRYDRYSKPLEAVDMDDNYASVKMGYDESLIIATNGKARYTEFAFSSAEDYDPNTGFFGGEVLKGSGSVNTLPHAQGVSHTGQHILGLDNGEEGFIFKARIGTDVEQFSTRGRRYRASVWWLPNGPGVDLDQGKLFYRIETSTGGILHSGSQVLSPDYDRKAGNWHQLNLDIEIPSGYNNHYLVVGVRNDNSTAYELYFDDFRFYPSDAPFKAYVYDKETDELTFILDENNMFTQFEYNDKGQLIRTYIETTENPKGKRLQTEHDYHYKRPLN
ncbi:MAG: hypothetical protein AAGG75_25985 [Bacteroidota bacterium]